MDASDIQWPHALTDEQMAILVVEILEEFRAGLTRRQFDEVMLAIFEHISGFETLPRSLSLQYLKVLWSRYKQAIQANQRRH